MNPIRSNVALLLAMPLLAAAQPEPKRATTPAEGARAIVAGLVRVAEANARLPKSRDGADGPVRLAGDRLTVLYVREAARIAKGLPDDVAAPSFLIALGTALDDSSILRKNPLTTKLCRQVERDDERETRLSVIGTPTMRDRRDWTQHFMVSCFLTEVVGEGLAEAAGILKEQMDARPGGSGFSFADLNADFAGVAFAVRLKKGILKLDTLADKFAVEDFLPRADGLSDGISQEEFAREYGTVSDPRFKEMTAKIRQRIEALPGYVPRTKARS
jgi:hypothetical protein